MSLAEELVQLHELFKAGGITQVEFDQLKKRIIGGNLREAKGLLNSKNNPSALQVGAMAAAGTFAGRMIFDHLQHDKELHAKIDSMPEVNLSDFSSFEFSETISVESVDTSNFDDGSDFDGIDFSF